MDYRRGFGLKRAAARAAAVLILIAINVAIAGAVFGVEYSAYLESNEGSFIAIARGVASHPRDLAWWPLWECGLPFDNTYLPLLPLAAG